MSMQLRTSSFRGPSTLRSPRLGFTAAIALFIGTHLSVALAQTSDADVNLRGQPSSNNDLFDSVDQSARSGTSTNSTCVTTQITNYTGANGRWSEPFVSGGKVAWYANPTSSTNLPNYFVYDVGSGVTTQLTNYTGGNGRWSPPYISNGLVAWYANPTSGINLPNYFVKVFNCDLILQSGFE